VKLFGIKIAGKTLKAVLLPVATAVVVHQVTTGKLDVKGAVLDALQGALDKRKA
jgi:hypothetical protein